MGKISNRNRAERDGRTFHFDFESNGRRFTQMEEKNGEKSLRQDTRLLIPSSPFTFICVYLRFIFSSFAGLPEEETCRGKHVAGRVWGK
jgi:hypothetical protein